MGRKCTKEQWEQVRHLFTINPKYKTREVAQIVGISQSVVCKLMKLETYNENIEFHSQVKKVEYDVIDMYKNGVPVKQISKLLSISDDSVYRIIDIHGIQRRGAPHKIYDDDTRQKCINMYLVGFSGELISCELGIHVNTVSAWAEKYGVRRSNDIARRGIRNARYKLDRKSKYCVKFNDEFRERVISYWDYKCVLCGIDEILNGRRLSVHHVIDNQERACCDADPSKWLFVSLCNKCHPKTFGRNIKAEIDAQIYKKLEDNSFKCYYTGDEYIQKYGEKAYINAIKVKKYIVINNSHSELHNIKD